VVVVHLRSVTAVGVTAAAATWLARAVRGMPAAFGASPAAIRASAPVETAANYREGRFHNTEPSVMVESRPAPATVVALVTGRHAGHPTGTVPLATPLAPADAATLAATWYGHASVLVEIDGHRVLTDPVWSERVSPSPLVGPIRMHPVPVALTALPPVDAIVISHDHYDHLDKDTVETLLRSQRAPFVVPLGVGAHLRHWGVPDERIVELGWGAATRVGELTITCTEARHFSGRGLVRNTTLWASWAIAGPTRRVYFGGDTGYSAAFAEIGRAHGPFDVTILPIGAYNEMWPDVHMNPEEAVRAHGDLNAASGGLFGVLLPIHWATFNLAFHTWSEPIRRALTAAEEAGVTVAAPMPGQRVDLHRPVSVDRWWERVESTDIAGRRPDSVEA
jgi:L-ascorbate metabolism protein UlaG (beta-lactamase superfamily)